MKTNKQTNKKGIVNINLSVLFIGLYVFYYYSPQTLGNNFFPLGKNFKFCKKEKIFEKKL